MSAEFWEVGGGRESGEEDRRGGVSERARGREPRLWNVTGPQQGKHFKKRRDVHLYYILQRGQKKNGGGTAPSGV